jgi:hypothetical protein
VYPGERPFMETDIKVPTDTGKNPDGDSSPAAAGVSGYCRTPGFHSAGEWA